MLMLTPFKEHPVQIKNKAGDILTTSHIGDDSVIVILASALPNWYLHGKFYINDVPWKTLMVRFVIYDSSTDLCDIKQIVNCCHL